MLWIRGPRLLVSAAVVSIPKPLSKGPRFYSTLKESDPLRILFCGSDDFSIESLNALYRVHKSEPELIESIDVVSRPPKPSGRGLRQLREVPIAQAARALSLPLHQINTFTGWQPPQPANASSGINLIVAVSFGLLVPPRLLRNAKYGGLNVHPSMLPDFGGPAPIHHTLLAGLTRTGVTLQTLHPERMDHGAILLQTPSPGFEIPRPSSITASELTKIAALVGAEMLIQGIRERVFVPPIEDRTPSLTEEEASAMRRAPKITPEDRRVRFDSWTADEVLRRQRILGPLWSQSVVDPAGTESVRRITWSGGFEEASEATRATLQDRSVWDGRPLAGLVSRLDGRLFVKTGDGKVLQTDLVKIDGHREQTAGAIMEKLRLLHPSHGADSNTCDDSIWAPLRGELK